ncbi:hypothetical protein EPI10_000996 [Gossypium australe]|uniref:Uncharacterized protein n=1 Tax=Gossypium australe TaxID=47621 RepID=A0A5B6V9P9_9ROSI|nr:hypothetical protein EPI10_000996 [Gossypium australe]
MMGRELQFIPLYAYMKSLNPTNVTSYVDLVFVSLLFPASQVLRRHLVWVILTYSAAVRKIDLDHNFITGGVFVVSACEAVLVQTSVFTVQCSGFTGLISASKTIEPNIKVIGQTQIQFHQGGF